MTTHSQPGLYLANGIKSFTVISFYILYIRYILIYFSQSMFSFGSVQIVVFFSTNRTVQLAYIAGLFDVVTVLAVDLSAKLFGTTWVRKFGRMLGMLISPTFQYVYISILMSRCDR